MSGEVTIRGRQQIAHKPTCGQVSGNRWLEPAADWMPRAGCCHRGEPAPTPVAVVPLTDETRERVARAIANTPAAHEDKFYLDAADAVLAALTTETTERDSEERKEPS